MKMNGWQRLTCIAIASAVLLSWPGAAMAADVDLDGIDDAQETTGGVTFNGVVIPPCSGTPAPGAARNACVSPSSKDIFVYLVTAPGGGFLGTAPAPTGCSSLLAADCLFKFVNEPATSTGTGKVDGLNMGVHVAYVTTSAVACQIPTEVVPIGSRGVGTLGQLAVQIIADDCPDSFVFGKADQGTPTNTGNAWVWPVKIKNYVVNGGGTTATWQTYLQRTFSHELSHVAALIAVNNSSYGGYHYATGSGVVMDQSVVYNSKRKTFTIYTDFASGDRPCLLRVDGSNPLQCLDFIIID